MHFPDDNSSPIYLASSLLYEFESENISKFNVSNIVVELLCLLKHSQLKTFTEKLYGQNKNMFIESSHTDEDIQLVVHDSLITSNKETLLQDFLENIEIIGKKCFPDIGSS